jgi:glycosyltransferase involved in cell wall biosynthesis
MRILCFGRFYDEIPGGMQRHVEHLFASLSDRVEYVHLVPSRTTQGARFTLHGAPVVRTPSLNVDGSLALSPGLVFEAMRLQRQYRFDLIHLHFPDPMSHLASLALPRHIPRIVSWHADIVRQKTLLRLYRPLLERAIRQAAALVVATPAHISNSSDLRTLADPKRTHVIPYGFDLRPFDEPHPQAQAIRERFPGKRVFALGRHVYYKGFDVLIRAWRDVDPEAHLVIGGVGPVTEQWQGLVRELGLSDRVSFVGLIDETMLPAYYQAADVFCLPAVSEAEAFGIVQVEAMASGVPVVSTRLNNGVDYVNQDGVSGLIVPPGDAQALAQALNRLLGDTALRARLGAQARERALSEFSMAAMGERMLDLYTNVLADAKPAG